MNVLWCNKENKIIFNWYNCPCVSKSRSKRFQTHRDKHEWIHINEAKKRFPNSKKLKSLENLISGTNYED